MKTYPNPQAVYNRPIQNNSGLTSVAMRQKKILSSINPIKTSPFYPLDTSQIKQVYSSPKSYNKNLQMYHQNQRYINQLKYPQQKAEQININSEKIGPQYYRYQYQRPQYNQTWSKIQTLLNKPVHYPNDIAYNQFGYKETRETAEDNYGIKINYNVQAANASRQNYHKYFTRQQGLVLKQIRNHSYQRVLSPKQYEQYKKIGLLQQYKSQQIKKIPKTTSRIQYIPYYRKVYDYEPRQIVDYIYVPVQKTALEHYSIQHVVDFQKREYFQTVLETVPEQKVKMRLQYIPIQQHILYVPEQSLESVQQRLKTNITNSKIGSFQQQEGQFVNGSFASLHVQNQNNFNQQNVNLNKLMTNAGQQNENPSKLSSQAIYEKQSNKNIENLQVNQSGSFVNRSNEKVIVSKAFQQNILKQESNITKNNSIANQNNKYLREDDRYEVSNKKYNNALPQSDRYQVKYQQYPSFNGSFYTNVINKQMQNEINQAKNNLNEVDSYQQLRENSQPVSPNKTISPQRNNDAQIEVN